MIYALYLNPTLDKTIYVENFAYGGTNRAQKSILQSGGKALNLAVVLHRLGTPVEVAGFLCREGCDAIERRLSDIPTSFVRLAGEPRTNLKIVDRAASVTTEVNEPGPAVSPEALAQLEAELSARLRPEDRGEEQLTLLATDGMLVKRPVLVDGDRVLVGFRPEEWEKK